LFILKTETIRSSGPPFRLLTELNLLHYLPTWKSILVLLWSKLIEVSEGFCIADQSDGVGYTGWSVGGDVIWRDCWHEDFEAVTNHFHQYSVSCPHGQIEYCSGSVCGLYIQGDFIFIISLTVAGWCRWCALFPGD